MIFISSHNPPPRCPNCDNLESIKQVCRRCSYEYPEEAGFIPLIGLISGIIGAILGVLFIPPNMVYGNPGFIDYAFGATIGFLLAMVVLLFIGITIWAISSAIKGWKS